MAETTKSLASRLLPERGGKLTRHQGVVTANGATGVSITLDGGTTPIDGVRHIASYSPGVGDTVEILKDGNDLFILGALAQDTGWKEPVYENGWAPYVNDPAHAWAFRYRRMGNSVFLNGLVKGDAATANIIFTLPVGYRPSRQLLAAILDSGGATTRFDINTSGSVFTSSRAVWLSLNHVTFPTDDAWPT